MSAEQDVIPFERPKARPPVDRRYLRAREMANPGEAYRSTAEVLDGWRTLRLKVALGKAFRHTERVSMHRPRWMPRRLYLWLLSTIVFEAPSEGDPR